MQAHSHNRDSCSQTTYKTEPGTKALLLVLAVYIPFQKSNTLKICYKVFFLHLEIKCLGIMVCEVFQGLISVSDNVYAYAYENTGFKSRTKSRMSREVQDTR